MMNFIKRLNWNAFMLMLLFTALGCASRTHDKTIMDSLIIFLIIGIPLSLMFLFINIKPKN